MKFILQTDIDRTHEIVAGEAEEDAVAAYRANRKPTVLFPAGFSIARERPVVTRDLLIARIPQSGMSTPRIWTVFSNGRGWPSGGTDRLGTVTRMSARPRNAGTFPISRHGLSFPGRVTVHWHGHVLSRATGQFDTSGVPPTSESSLEPE